MNTFFNPFHLRDRKIVKYWIIKNVDFTIKIKMLILYYLSRVYNKKIIIIKDNN